MLERDKSSSGWRRKVAVVASAAAMAAALVAVGALMRGSSGATELLPIGNGLLASGSRDLAAAMKDLKADKNLADSADDIMHPHRAAREKAKRALEAKKRKESGGERSSSSSSSSDDEEEDSHSFKETRRQAHKKPESEAQQVKEEEEEDCEPFCGSPSSGLKAKSGDNFGKSLVQALAAKGISTTDADRTKAAIDESAQKGMTAKKEAQRIEARDCKPFCGVATNRAERKEQDGALHAERQARVSGTGKLGDLSPKHAQSRKPLTVEDKKKIKEAADKIANVISDANSLNQGDVKREMAQINKGGTGWNALWDSSSSSSLSSTGRARFQYLTAGPDGGQSHQNLLGQGFHY